jgi:hypothetical protein
VPIKLWSDEGQSFVDSSTRAPLTAQEFADLVRSLPPDRRVEVAAYIDALLARQAGEKTH